MEIDKIHKEFEFVKIAFENGKITEMKQLKDYKATRLSKLTGINYGRFISKLYNPSDFTPSEIIRLAIIINIDSGLIMRVIELQVRKDEQERVIKNFLKHETQKRNII